MGVTLLPMVSRDRVAAALIAAGTDGDGAGEARTLGSGGQGTVYPLDAGFAARGHGRLAYKEYRERLLRGHEVALRLLWDRIIQRPEELERRNPRYAEYVGMVRRYAAWPVAVVERDGMACGVLEPAVDEAWLNPRGVDGATGKLDDWMRRDTPQAARTLAEQGRTPLSPAGRAATAYQILHCYALLHWMGFVIGDVSFKNIMAFVSAHDQDGADGVRVCLLEMETLREDGYGAVFFTGDSPNFEAPERTVAADAGKVDEYLNTQASDVYKAALLTVRLFAQGERRPLLVQSVTDAVRRALQDAGLGEAAVAALEASLDDRPENRPTMVELAGVFPAP